MFSRIRTVSTIRENPYSGVFYAAKMLPSNLVILNLFRASNVNGQKPPPNVLYKKSWSQKFRNIHRKTSCWSLFLIKEAPTQVFSCENCEIFKNTYFEEYLRTAASKRPGNSCFWNS